MRFYEFTGAGVAIEAVVVVFACRLDAARKVAEQWASENHVAPDSLRLKKVANADIPAVVFGWNGDY